jgi:hypothetical protein
MHDSHAVFRVMNRQSLLIPHARRDIEFEKLFPADAARKPATERRLNRRVTLDRCRAAGMDQWPLDPPPGGRPTLRAPDLSGLSPWTRRIRIAARRSRRNDDEDDDNGNASLPKRLGFRPGAIVDLTASKYQIQPATMRSRGIPYQRVMKNQRFACGSAARAHHIFLARNSFRNFSSMSEQSFHRFRQ